MTLALASGQLGVTFRPLFAEVLAQLQQYVNVILATPLVELLLNALRRLGLPIPELALHGKPLFTLSALVMLAISRNQVAMRPLAIASGVLRALVPAIMAGTMPQTSASMSRWPIAGIFLFSAIVLGLARGSRGEALGFLALASGALLLGYLFVIVG
jgi:hypothetical protein